MSRGGANIHFNTHTHTVLLIIFRLMYYRVFWLFGVNKLAVKLTNTNDPAIKVTKFL